MIIIAPNFLPESVGGASRIYEMAKSLQQFYNVTVVCPPPTYPFTKYKKAKYLFHKETLDGISVFRVWTYQPSTPNPSFLERFLYYTVFPFLTTFFLFSLLRNASLVIVSTPPSSLLITSLVVRLFQKKLIIDIRDLWVEALIDLGYVNKNSLLIKLTKKFEIYCWRKSNLILANSITTVERIKKITGLNSSKIKYFPFHVDLNIFKKKEIKQEKQIVYIGNFGIAQNLEVLINAMPLVISKIRDLKVKLYGGGFCEPKIRELVANLNLQDYIEFHNPVSRDKIPLILSESLVGIVSVADNKGLRSALPTKTFEYFACSLPVLAYGGSDELERIINESKAGIYIKGNDSNKIAEEMIQLLSSEKTLKELSVNGRKFVEKKQNYSFLLEL